MSPAFLSFPYGLGNGMYDVTKASKSNFPLKVEKKYPLFPWTNPVSVPFLHLEDFGTSVNISDTW